MIAVVFSLLLVTQTTGHLPADCAEASNTLEINACAARDLSRETERMDHYLTAARRNADAMDQATAGTPDASAQRDHLDKAQTAWAAYADIVCDGVHDRWKGGTIRTVAALRCRIDMTRERTHVVWRGYLSPADASPPDLPEPLQPVSEELQYDD